MGNSKRDKELYNFKIMTIDNEDLSKPLLEEGLKGQILRFGEHNIAHLRKALYEGVNESIQLSAEEKDIRKQLMDKMLVAIMTILDMEGQVNTNKAIVKEINEFLAELQGQIADKCLLVGGLEKENREYKQKISALTKQLKGEQQYADEQEEALAKINQEMEPYKKQNKQLMSIIGAAEKGHNLLLNTMQNINSKIAGNF